MYVHNVLDEIANALHYKFLFISRMICIKYGVMECNYILKYYCK